VRHLGRGTASLTVTHSGGTEVTMALLMRNQLENEIITNTTMLHLIIHLISKPAGKQLYSDL
jgi:hypothetical protein